MPYLFLIIGSTPMAFSAAIATFTGLIRGNDREGNLTTIGQQFLAYRSKVRFTVERPIASDGAGVSVCYQFLNMPANCPVM